MGDTLKKRQVQVVVSNFRRGPHPGAVLVIAPALVAVLALGGVTSPPALSLSSRREAVANAERRSAEFDAEFALSQRYRKLDLARRGRLAIEVESLAIGEMVVPELPARFDRVAAQTFDLGVTGSLDAFARLERHVEALDFPCCVLLLEIDLPLAAGSQATARMRLGLLHLASGLPAADETSSDGNRESP
jgi:hypothetical protein